MVINFCTALSVGLFTFFAMLGWTVVRRAVDAQASRIEDALHMYSLLWLSLLAILVGFGLVMMVNGWRRPRLRYIVSPLVLFPYCTLMIIYALLAVPMIVHLEVGFNRWLPALMLTATHTVYCGIKDFDKAFGPLVLTASAGLVGLLAAFRAHSLTALDLVLDVIAHFKEDARGLSIAGLGRRHIGATKAGKERWVWESLVDRFQDVTSELVREHAVERLVVVSHSQGTPIALTGLGILQVTGTRKRTAPAELEAIAVDVVTMGCPVSHLYQHYLASQYTLDPSLDRRYRWLNVYREDDFIGTVVKGPHPHWPENRPVGARGHTDYWRDREVLQAVLGWLKLA